MVKPLAWKGPDNGAPFLAALLLGVVSFRGGAQELLAGGLKALTSSSVLAKTLILHLCASNRFCLCRLCA